MNTPVQRGFRQSSHYNNRFNEFISAELTTIGKPYAPQPTIIYATTNIALQHVTGKNNSNT